MQDCNHKVDVVHNKCWTCTPPLQFSMTITDLNEILKLEDNIFEEWVEKQRKEIQNKPIFDIDLINRPPKSMNEFKDEILNHKFQPTKIFIDEILIRDIRKFGVEF